MLDTPHSPNHSPEKGLAQKLAAGVAIITPAVLFAFSCVMREDQPPVSTHKANNAPVAKANDGSLKMPIGARQESTEKHVEMELTQDAARNILQKLGYDVDEIMKAMRADPAIKDTLVAWTYATKDLEGLLAPRIREADPAKVVAQLTVEVRRVDGEPTIALLLHQSETSEVGQGLILFQGLERVLPGSPPMSLTQVFGAVQPEQLSEAKTEWKRQQMFLRALKKIPRNMP